MWRFNHERSKTLANLLTVMSGKNELSGKGLKRLGVEVNTGRTRDCGKAAGKHRLRKSFAKTPGKKTKFVKLRSAGKAPKQESANGSAKA